MFLVLWDDVFNVIFCINGYTYIDGGFNVIVKVLMLVFFDLIEEECWWLMFAFVLLMFCLGMVFD